MQQLSYPKNKIKVLLLEGVHPAAIELFENEGLQVETHPGSMSKEELLEKIEDVHLIGIRSKTFLDAEVLARAKKLLGIGAFCIGTNQIDLKAAAIKGVPVFNAPYSNTRSVVELAIGQIIMLLRGTFQKSQEMHSGIWNKSAANSYEVRGKKLGIVGYGNIGSQLSVLAEALGMEVYFYDIAEKLPLGNAKKCQSLEEMLSLSDIVSIHVDGRKSNQNLFDAAMLQRMKKGSILINLSRGHLLDLDALKNSLESGHLIGASIDVFPEEPIGNRDTFTSNLAGIHSVILTPHIGGSTIEAQENIGKFVPNKLLDFLNNGSSQGAVNFPEIILPKLQNSHRILHIHHNMPGVLAQINKIMADLNINIQGQYLKTMDEIGYVISDIAPTDSEKLREPMRSIEFTIKYRELF